MNTLYKKLCVAAMCAICALAAAALVFAGTASVAASAADGDPLGAVTLTADKKGGDVLITDSFTYGQPTAASIGQSPLSFEIANKANDPRTEMTLGRDYSYADGTIILKKRLTETLSEGIYWLNFDANGNYEYVLDVRGEGNWVVNESKGSKAANGNDTVISLNGWTGNYNTDGRAHYTEALDVSKPIYLPITNLNASGAGDNWVMLALDKDPYSAEYISETDKTPGVVKILDMAASARTGEGERLQGFAGFLQQSGVLHISEIINTVNFNMFEIYIGETASESYLKVNGHKIGFGSTEVKRGDFPNGVAYLDLYASNDLSFSMPSDLGASFAYYDFDAGVREQPYLLKSEQDLKFYVTDAGDGFTVSYGGTALTADDFTVEENLVTLKGSYLKNIPYTEKLVFTLEKDGRKSDVKFATTVSGEAAAGVANGESDVKFFEGSDLTFKLELGEENYMGLIDVLSGERVSAAAYSDGVLTVPASVLSAYEKGTYKFLVETDSGLFPIVIVREEFTVGVRDMSGSSSYGIACGAAEVSEKSDLKFDALFDLTEKLTLKLDISEHGDYYRNGNGTGDDNSYIALAFTDVFGGNTLTVRVRANSEADGTSRYKSWVDFSLENAEGKPIGSATRIFSRAVTKGSHSITLEHGETGFTLTFDEDSPVSIADTSTDVKNMQLRMISTENYKFTIARADVDYSKLPADCKLRFGASQAEVDAAVAAFNSSDAGCGCGSLASADFAALAVAIIAVSALAVCFTFIKRKSDAKTPYKK